jgi:hypothetical protein
LGSTSNWSFHRSCASTDSTDQCVVCDQTWVIRWQRCPWKGGLQWSGFCTSLGNIRMLFLGFAIQVSTYIAVSIIQVIQVSLIAVVPG